MSTYSQTLYKVKKQKVAKNKKFAETHQKQRATQKIVCAYAASFRHDPTVGPLQTPAPPLVGGSTRQELYDRKIYGWFEDEKDLKGDLEWFREEERVEREWFRVTSELRYAGRLELSVLYVRERTLCWILSFLLCQWRDFSIGVIWWNLEF